MDYDPARVSPDDLVAAVEAAGYAAPLPGDAAAPAPDDRLRLRVIVTARARVPVIAYAMASGAAVHRAATGSRWR